MRFAMSVVLFLFAAYGSAVFGQGPPVVTVGEIPAPAAVLELRGKVGERVRLVSDKPVRWASAVESSGSLFPDPDGKAAYFVPARAGTHYILAATGDTEPGRVVVIVDGPDPAPGPPSPIPPPAPVDPLKAKLRAAFLVDGGDMKVKADALADLVELFKQMGEVAYAKVKLPNGAEEYASKTAGELAAKVKAASDGLAKDRLPGLRAVIKSELSAAMSVAFASAEAPLTDDSRAVAKSVFARFQAALSEASK